MRSSFEVSPAMRRAVFVADGSAPAQSAAGSAEGLAEEQSALERQYALGHEAARAELAAESCEQVSSALAALQHGASALARVTNEEREAVRAAVVELALALAGRLVARELREDCEALAPLVEEALGILPVSDGVALALSNADAALVREGHAPELERLRSEWSAELVADPTLSPGEALVRSGAATVELRLAAVLERFREGLLERMPLAEEPT